VEKIVRDARRRARNPDRELTLDDLFAVIGRDLSDLDPHYVKLIAIHEAGHAVAAVVLEVSRNVGISLFQRGGSSAATFFEPQVEAVTRKVVERRIAVALAGRAAEQVILGDVTAGAGGSDTSDLALANALAFSAVARWGLSDVDELIWVAGSAEQLTTTHPRLAEAAEAMRRSANECALELIRQHASQVRAVADALVQRRALAHEDILVLMGLRSRGRKGGAKSPRGKRPTSGRDADKPLTP
jgi:ATP-dependent Zn protease